MAEEFVINSSAIETKINQLLPSQGGFQPGVDFSASTMVIPIIDLTETAEGSSLRLDLQKAQDFATKQTSLTNATNTVIENTTGFWRVILSIVTELGGNNNAELNIFDGTTSKPIFARSSVISGTGSTATVFDTIAYLRAGDSLRGTFASNGSMEVFTRQIADVSGNLTNPLGFV
jgi:hypothetical protein